jgi:glyoxylase-like metal-dependent hydrolase (beta-lactamase superfamily II)
MARLNNIGSALVAGVLSISALPVANAQDQAAAAIRDSTYASAVAARHILERAIQAMGGQGTLDSITDIERTLVGKRVGIGQSSAPDAPFRTAPVILHDIVEPKSGRFVNDMSTGNTRNIIVARDRSSANMIVPSQKLVGIAPPTLTGYSRPVPAPYRYPEMWLPIALNRAASLRSLGQTNVDGRMLNRVAFADGFGTMYTLSFDAASGLPAYLEWLTDETLYSVAGDLPREVVYSDYRDVHGFKSPFRYTVLYARDTLEDLAVSDIAVNTHPADSLFAVPEGYAKMPLPNGPLLDVQKLADDVYFVRAPYNSMFVVFNEYVLVIEAPLNDFLTQATIAAIKKTAPGKAIRYVVPTHYHHDHIGGLRGYGAEGAIVVTTAGIEPEIERLVHATRLRPDALALHPRDLHVERFNGKRVFADGSHRVELYNIGPTIEANDLVIAYVPAAKALYEADEFDISTGELPPAGPATIELAQKIDSLHLDVETIIPTHGRRGTMADLKKALSLRRDSISTRSER